MTTPATIEQQPTLEDVIERIANRRAARFNDMLFESLARLRAHGATEDEVREANEQALEIFGETLREQLAVIASEIGSLLPRRRWQ